MRIKTLDLVALVLLLNGCATPQIWGGFSVNSQPGENYTGKWKDLPEKGYYEPEVIEYRDVSISFDAEFSWESAIVSGSWDFHNDVYSIGVQVPLWVKD